MGFQNLRLRRLVQLHQRNFRVKQPGGVVLLKDIIIHDNHSVLLAFTMTLLSAAMMSLLVPHANMAQQCPARGRKKKKKAQHLDNLPYSEHSGRTRSALSCLGFLLTCRICYCPESAVWQVLGYVLPYIH